MSEAVKLLSVDLVGDVIETGGTHTTALGPPRIGGGYDRGCSDVWFPEGWNI